MIPEFIGRLPIIVSTRKLTVKELVRVLVEPTNALLRQYQKQFQLCNVAVHFTPDACEAIAVLANTKGTGARGLRSITESVLKVQTTNVE